MKNSNALCLFLDFGRLPMKMLLPILLRCHAAAFLELPVEVRDIRDSDLVADLLGGGVGGGEEAFGGGHAFVHDVAAE